ncbi:MAG: PACE efflux transporter [Desulfobacula sp.]|jgi:uncharacterized membrane protein|uniref:PACE efflux transporter n=2 Tax=Desulfobacula sp. TaxID=2593537 RepID=UPI0039B86607|nr:PACE efflux transporter [Desulfobacula sp.]
MNHKPKMRNSLDRVRHAIFFEVVLLLLTIIVLTELLDQSAVHMGGFSLIMALIAIVWNYLFNCFFDHALVYFQYPLYPRGLKLRAFHSMSFEFGLMLISVPFTMVWMDFGFIQALGFDIAFTIVVLIYTIIFNYTYDMIFPVPQII